jgi:DNA-binding MarR family transcriptional regulator
MFVPSRPLGDHCKVTADHDLVDDILQQWHRELPGLDVSGMAVIGRISRLSRILERRIATVLAQHGLNESQFGVLAALRRAGAPYCLTPTALYNSLLISSGAMTNRLDRLTAIGLVRRIPDPEDGRSVLVALTPRGLKVIEAAVRAHTENELEMLAALTPKEQRTFADLLRKQLLASEGDNRASVQMDSVRIPKSSKASRRRNDVAD